MTGKDIAQPIQIPSLTLNLARPRTVQSNPSTMISGGTTLNAQLPANYSRRLLW